MKICKGSCTHPVLNNDRHTLYAAIKARIANQDDNVDEPCCVPIKYKKVPLIYANPSQQNKLTLDMAEPIATECGCR